MYKPKLHIYLIICILTLICRYCVEFDDHVKPKVVLYWTKFYNADDFELGLGSLFKGCPHDNCFLTNDRNLMSIEDYNAIFFHGVEYCLTKHGAPKKRSSHQHYVFYNLESPRHTHIKGPFKNFYNWTMTYREDSDLFRPYGFVVREKKNYSMPTVDDIRGRSKKIAWFVSHCYTKSRREKLVEAIGQEIPVDVYGRCGKLVCSRSNETKCYKHLEENYKFYLSFENSICNDYVTEKLFNVLNLNIVPIVYGGANYDEIAPPHSVIDASKYNNVSDLVKYIKRLDNNVTEYLEYLKWKRDFVIDTSSQRILCNLCEKLNQPVVNKVYEDIRMWWEGTDKPMCREPPKYIPY